MIKSKQDVKHIIYMIGLAIIGLLLSEFLPRWNKDALFIGIFLIYMPTMLIETWREDI